jgi:hypothetical protein
MRSSNQDNAGRRDQMSEQEKTEATILVGLMTREELLGLPEDVTFLQSKRPHQVKPPEDPVKGSDPGVEVIQPKRPPPRGET